VVENKIRAIKPYRPTLTDAAKIGRPRSPVAFAARAIVFVGCSVVDESERKAASAALFEGQNDPDLEERVNEGFLVFAEVDRSQPDVCDDRFDCGAIGCRSAVHHDARAGRPFRTRAQCVRFVAQHRSRGGGA
jgi:hypothetical protein